MKLIPMTLIAGLLWLPSWALGSGKSLHLLDASWTTDAGKSVRLSDWKGKRVVITMLYASCHGTCPLIIKKLKKIQKKLDERKVSADFLMVSFDPEADTPQALAKYRKGAGLTEPNWVFLSGKPEDVRRLSLLLGIRYTKNPENDEIMHDNKILLLNEKGEIHHVLNGLDAPLDQLFD